MLGKVKSLDEARRRRSDHRRRARGRPRDHVPPLGARAARRGARRADPQAGRRRRRRCSPIPARCQVMLVTLPEETPVSEVDRHRVRDRGPRRRRARPGRRQPVLRRRSPTACRPRPTPIARGRGSVRAVRLGARSRRTSRTRPRSAPSGTRSRHEQIARLREQLPLPQIELAVPVHARHRRARRSTRSPTRSRAGSRRCERTSDATASRSSSTTSRVVDLLRQRRRRQDDDRRGARARRRAPGRNACVVTIDPAKRLADALGLEQLSDTPSEIDRERWDDDGTAMPGGALSALMLDTKSTFDQLVTAQRRRRPSRRSASSTTASTATSPARSAARRSTWRWRSCTSCTTKAASTSSSSTRRRRGTRSTSSTRRGGCTRLLDNRIFRLLMMPTRAYLRVASVAVQTFLRTVAQVVGSEVDRRRRRVLPRVRGHGGRASASGRSRSTQLLADAGDRVRARHVAAARRDGGGAVLRRAARRARPDDRRR